MIAHGNLSLLVVRTVAPALTQSPNALVNPVITGDLGDRELL
jgi:hypothetical protein